ncbi:MAG TPA: hypothetical protein PLV78_02050 [Deltaproteobacteria bacterium]|nr:hypothetical protein [Deltaproteobacteria bacterium]
MDTLWMINLCIKSCESTGYCLKLSYTVFTLICLFPDARKRFGDNLKSAPILLLDS